MIISRQSLILAAVILGALILEAVILWWFFGGSGSDDNPTSRDSLPEARLEETAGCGSISLAGGEGNSSFVRGSHYAIEVPAAWEGDLDGSVVTLTKRNGRATLSIGRARPGELSGALDDLRDSLRRTYPRLEVTRVEPILIDGCPARWILGRAANRRGARLSFEGVVVSAPTGNFVMAGFRERGAEPQLDFELSRTIRSVEFLVADARARS
jgi:hypothetical protein